MPLWTLVDEPLWKRDIKGNLVALRRPDPYLSMSWSLLEFWCCVNFVSGEHDVLRTPALQHKSPRNWVEKYTISSGSVLSYVLQDGTQGVCFADGTEALLWGKQQELWTYVDRETVSTRRWPASRSLSPELLSKARRLGDIASPHASGNSTGPFYIHQWARTPEAIVFVLNSNIVHALFSDQYEMVLTLETICKGDKVGTRSGQRMEYLQRVLRQMSPKATSTPKNITAQQTRHNATKHEPSVVILDIPKNLRPLRKLKPKRLFVDSIGSCASTENNTPSTDKCNGHDREQSALFATSSSANVVSSNMSEDLSQISDHSEQFPVRYVSCPNIPDSSRKVILNGESKTSSDSTGSSRKHEIDSQATKTDLECNRTGDPDTPARSTCCSNPSHVDHSAVETRIGDDCNTMKSAETNVIVQVEADTGDSSTEHLVSPLLHDGTQNVTEPEAEKSCLNEGCDPRETAAFNNSSYTPAEPCVSSQVSPPIGALLSPTRTNLRSADSSGPGACSNIPTPNAYTSARKDVPDVEFKLHTHDESDIEFELHRDESERCSLEAKIDEVFVPDKVKHNNQETLIPSSEPSSTCRSMTQEVDHTETETIHTSPTTVVRFHSINSSCVKFPSRFGLEESPRTQAGYPKLPSREEECSMMHKTNCTVDPHGIDQATSLETEGKDA